MRSITRASKRRFWPRCMSGQRAASMADEVGEGHGEPIAGRPGTLPEQVTLPDPDAIRDFLQMAETRILPETASPLALLALFIVIAAGPVVTRDRPVVDGPG